MSLRLTQFLILWLAFTLTATGQRQLESLGRGVVAMRTGTTAAYVGWRLLGDDRADVAFNLYRSSGGGAAVKINPAPLTATTDFQDNAANFSSSVTYFVRPVIAGVEQAPSASFTLPPNAATRQYLEIPLQVPPGGTSPDGVNFTYTANDASAGDLDGDGEYEIVLRWEPTNSWGGGIGGHTGPVLLDAYKQNGTRLWRIHLGPNINASAHITCFVVYDLDGDGKAELACMTSDGSIDGLGAIIGNPSADHRGPNGVVLVGPEYLTIFNGQTGAAMTSTLFVPQRHPDTLYPTSQQIDNIWGDGYGNRVNRFLTGVAYVDGQRPSLIFARGYYTRTVISAWDWRDAALTKRWTFDSDDGTPGNAAYRGQGAHSLSIGDLDGDGRDEVSYGACAIDDDGTGLWNSGLGHGDATHLSDMDPDRPGLEFYMPHEDPGSYGPYGTSLLDARTGDVILGLSGNGSDVGRCVAFDIDPNHPGFEMWAANSGLVFNSKGNPIPTTTRPSYNFGVWWDADFGRELLDQNRIDKWVPANGNTTRLLTATGASSANGTKATPALSADLFGDWREEVVWRASDESHLRIYTTTIPATSRLYTLMHDPHYRVAIAWQNSGYNQPPHPGFFLGYHMSAPPRSPIWRGDLVWKSGPAWNTSAASFKPTPIATTTAVFADGQSVLFDGSGNPSAAVLIDGTLHPSEVVVHNPTGHHYTFSGGGGLAGPMTLTKSGSGTFSITGTHHYAGQTLVNQGKLQLTGTLANSHVRIQGNGSLGGSGTLGAGLTTEARAVISPGNTGAGTLTITGTASLQSAVLDLDLVATPGGTHDRLAITGNLVLGGTTKLRFHPLAAMPAPGSYTLATYTGSLTGGAGNLTYEGLVGLPANLTVGNGAIVLEITATRNPAAVIWRGTGGVWDLDQSENWLLAGAPATFVTGDAVTFDATGAAASSITLGGIRVPASVTISGNNNYTFTGAGGIGGSGGLTKSGAGNLTLSTTSTYTGPTSLSGGTVSVSTLSSGGAPGPLGAADSSPANLVLADTILRSTATSTTTDRGITLSESGAALDVPSSATLILLGNLTGPGTLTKTGPGTLTLSAANDYSGGTLISAGTVRLGDDTANQFALGSGIVTLAGGTLTMNNSEGGGSPLSSWPVHVPAGFTGRLNVDGRCTLGGALTGGGTFNFHSAFYRADVAANWSNFAGQINVITDSDGGEFRVASTAGFPNARLDLSGVLHMISRATAGATIPIGHLTGNSLSVISAGFGSGAAAQNPVTWRVGGLGLDGTYAGKIQGSTNLIKEGAGTLNLSGANTHTGTTTISGGALRVSGSTTGSNISVQNLGLLTGGGTVTGNVTVANGGAVAFGLTPDATESLRIVGNLSVAGDFLVSARLLGGSLVPGSYPLLSYTGTLSGTPAFVWSPPPGSQLSAQIIHTAPSGENPGTITVTLTTPPRAPAEIIWTGSSNSSWDNSTLNWKHLGVPDVFRTGDTAIFDQTGNNSSPISLLGNLEPAAVIVDAEQSYSFGGTGMITGAATLEKAGGGTLTISGTHEFTGGTTIRGGTLGIATAAALGSGSVTLAGGTWATGALTPNNPILVTADSTITGGHSGGSHGIRSVSGNQRLVLTATNVFDLEGSLAGFSGRIALNGSGSFRFFGGSGSATAAFDLGTRSLNARSGNTFSLGSLEGAAGSQLLGSSGSGNTQPVTYTVGGNNADSVFSGTIINGGGATSLVKTGAGTLTLAGTNTHTGTTRVSGGKLSVTGSLAATATTIEALAALGGGGAIGGNVTCHGTLVASEGLSLAGDLTLSPGARIAFDPGAATGVVAVGGVLTLDGTLDITAAGGFTAGTFTIINHSGPLANNILTVGAVPANHSAVVDTAVAGQIRVVVTRNLTDYEQWWISHFLTLDNPAGAPSADPDGDGQTNAVEFLAGTDPQSGTSLFAATLTPENANEFILSWPSVPGKSYRIDRTATLDGVWEPWVSLPAADSPATTTRHAVTLEGSAGFYRIAILP
jgi:fibronectin-binding autotransporter adhesin